MFLPLEPHDWPEAAYDLVYPDPPWPYKDKAQQRGGATRHYSTMTLDEICALPVSRLARKDSMLFLWATGPNLPMALLAMEAWGFKYVGVGFTWIKSNKDNTLFMGMGHYTRANAEFCFMGKRGKGLKRFAKNVPMAQTHCAAFLAKHYGGVVGHGVEQPIGTITSIDHHSLIGAFLTQFNGQSIGSDAREPLPTATAMNKFGEVRAFLMKYYAGGEGQRLDDSMHTITTLDRFGLVTVAGIDYQIIDIGLRMLQPRELAKAQGMPDDYILTGSKTQQVKCIGNSVSPPPAEALVRANYKAAKVAAVGATA